MKTATLTPSLLRAYRWFRSQGVDAKHALACARAERAARDAGCQFIWEDDPEGWYDLRADNYRCACGCGHKIESCEMVRMVDADNEPLPYALGVICDADDAYRRIVEADLALDFVADEIETIAERTPQL